MSLCPFISPSYFVFFSGLVSIFWFFRCSFVALFWYRNNCDELVIFISGCCYWRVWPKNREFTLYGKLFEHWFTFAWFLLVKNLLDSGNAGMILLIYFFFVFFTVKLEELKKFKFNTVKFRLFFIWEFGLLELLEWYI